MDPSYLLLIQRFPKAGRMDSGELIATEGGVSQSGGLGPMLSRILLRYVLDLWFEQRITREVRGACLLVRCADFCVDGATLGDVPGSMTPDGRSVDADGAVPPRENLAR